MRIKSLAQGENILMLGIEPSTFVSKVDILTTTPIVHIVLYCSKTNSTQILHYTEEIDLGDVCDTKLSFRNHISMDINKANRLLGITRRSFCALHKTSFTPLCNEIVRPHLEYAATILNPYKKAILTTWKRYNAGQPNFFKTFHI